MEEEGEGKEKGVDVLPGGYISGDPSRIFTGFPDVSF